MKTPQQAKEDLQFRGQSVADWARANGVSPELTHRVLSGRLKGRRGEAHKIAVKLGIKDGVIPE